MLKYVNIKFAGSLLSIIEPRREHYYACSRTLYKTLKVCLPYCLLSPGKLFKIVCQKLLAKKLEVASILYMSR